MLNFYQVRMPKYRIQFTIFTNHRNSPDQLLLPFVAAQLVGLSALIERGIALKLERVPVPGAEVAIYCGTSTKVARPYITHDSRKQAFALVLVTGQSGDAAFHLATHRRPHL